MKSNRLFVIAALLGTVLAGCQKAEEEIGNPEEKPDVEKSWTLTVKAAKKADTRALDYSGNELHAIWATGEKVDVFGGGAKLGTLQVTAVDDEGVATLSGDVSAQGLDENSMLKLLYPGTETAANGLWTYVGQDGSAPQNAFDYATAELTVASLDENTHTIVTSDATADFLNEQSIYRFGFKESGTAISVASFTIASSQKQIVRNRTYTDGNWSSPNEEKGALAMFPTSASNNEYFASIRNESTSSSNNYSFTVVRSSDNALLEGTKNLNTTLSNGQFYNATVKVSQKTYSPASGTINTENEVL